MRICVYAASSAHCDAVYQSAARRLGFLLAEAGATIVYGGGGTGLMGAVADGALDAGGYVIGIIPRFIPYLRASAFRERFLAKGRFASYLEGVSMHVITHESPGLIGAAAALQQGLRR